ncbi:MAG: hypothetical protein V1882_09425 [Candidatus Omnitrophota bacterium]
MNFRSLRIASGLVCFIFLVTSINPVANAMTPATEVSPMPFKTLEIPAEFGQVTETITGDAKAPVLIHIQSAHGSYEAEKNIENLLGYIEKNSKIRTMFLEGAANKLQPELFRIFPDHPDFNRQVTDKLMQEGYLTGPERFLIENASQGTRAKGHKNTGQELRAKGHESWNALGMEDLDAYKKDRDAFIKVVKADKATQTFLRQLRADLEKRFTATLNKDLLNLVRQEDSLDAGMLSFEGWLKSLGEASQKHLKQDLSDAFYQNHYPFLVRYFRLRSIGTKIDQEKAMKESDDFLKELEKRKIDKNIVDSFRATSQEPRATEKDRATSQDSRVTNPAGQNVARGTWSVDRAASGYSPLRRAFDLLFSKLPKDFSMKAWPNWTLYAQYMILMQEMESKGLHEETTQLKSKIQNSLAKTAEEKEYLAQARHLSLLRKLFSLELTRREYEEVNNRATYHEPRTTNSVDHGPWLVAPAAQTLFATAMSFYDTAVLREQKMFTNALKKMDDAKEQRAILVTGGFHAEGIKKLASEKNCSYLQITPRIQEVTQRDHEMYLRSMLGTREFETSQIVAALALMSSAQRIAVAGREKTREWLTSIGDTIREMISVQLLSLQPAYVNAYAVSSLGRAEVRTTSSRSETRLEPTQAMVRETLKQAEQGQLSGDEAVVKGAATALGALFGQTRPSVARLSTIYSPSFGTVTKIVTKNLESKQQTPKALEGFDVVMTLKEGGSTITAASIKEADEVLAQQGKTTLDLSKIEFVHRSEMRLLANNDRELGRIIEQSVPGSIWDGSKIGRALGLLLSPDHLGALAVVHRQVQLAKAKALPPVVKKAPIHTYRGQHRVAKTPSVRRDSSAKSRSEVREQVTISISDKALRTGKAQAVVQGITIRLGGSYSSESPVAADLFAKMAKGFTNDILSISAYFEGSGVTEAGPVWLGKDKATQIPGTNKWVKLISGKVGGAVTIELESRSEARGEQEGVIKAQNRRVAAARGLTEAEVQRLETEKPNFQGFTKSLTHLPVPVQNFQEFTKNLTHLPLSVQIALGKPPVVSFRRGYLPDATIRHRETLELLERNGVIVPVEMGAQWPWEVSNDSEMPDIRTPFLDLIRSVVNPNVVDQLEKSPTLTLEEMLSLAFVFEDQRYHLYPVQKEYFPNSTDVGSSLRYRIVLLMARCLAQIDLKKDPNQKENRKRIIQILRGVKSPVTSGLMSDAFDSGDADADLAHFVANLYDSSWLNRFLDSGSWRVWSFGEELLLRGDQPESVRNNIRKIQGNIEKSAFHLEIMLISLRAANRRHALSVLAERNVLTREIYEYVFRGLTEERRFRNDEAALIDALWILEQLKPLPKVIKIYVKGILRQFFLQSGASYAKETMSAVSDRLSRFGLTSGTSERMRASATDRSEIREKVTIPFSDKDIQAGRAKAVVQGIEIRLGDRFSHELPLPVFMGNAHVEIRSLPAYFEGPGVTAEGPIRIGKNEAAPIPGTNKWVKLISGKVGGSVTIELESRSEARGITQPFLKFLDAVAGEDERILLAGARILVVTVGGFITTLVEQKFGVIGLTVLTASVLGLSLGVFVSKVILRMLPERKITLKADRRHFSLDDNGYSELMVFSINRGGSSAHIGISESYGRSTRWFDAKLNESFKIPGSWSSAKVVGIDRGKVTLRLSRSEARQSPTLDGSPNTNQPQRSGDWGNPDYHSARENNSQGRQQTTAKDSKRRSKNISAVAEKAIREQVITPGDFAKNLQSLKLLNGLVGMAASLIPHGARWNNILKWVNAQIGELAAAGILALTAIPGNQEKNRQSLELLNKLVEEAKEWHTDKAQWSSLQGLADAKTGELASGLQAERFRSELRTMPRILARAVMTALLFGGLVSMAGCFATARSPEAGIAEESVFLNSMAPRVYNGDALPLGTKQIFDISPAVTAKVPLRVQTEDPDNRESREGKFLLLTDVHGNAIAVPMSGTYDFTGRFIVSHRLLRGIDLRGVKGLEVVNDLEKRVPIMNGSHYVIPLGTEHLYDIAAVLEEDGAFRVPVENNKRNGNALQLTDIDGQVVKLDMSGTYSMDGMFTVPAELLNGIGSQIVRIEVVPTRSEVRLTADEKILFKKALKALEPQWGDGVFVKSAAKRRMTALNVAADLLNVTGMTWLLFWKLIQKMDKKMLRRSDLWAGDRLKELLSEIDRITKAGQDFEVVYTPYTYPRDQYPGSKYFGAVTSLGAGFVEPVAPQGLIWIRPVEKTTGAANLKNRSEARSRLSTIPDGIAKNAESGEATVRAEIRDGEKTALEGKDPRSEYIAWLDRAAEQMRLRKVLEDMQLQWWDDLFVQNAAERRSKAFIDAADLLNVVGTRRNLLWPLVQRTDKKAFREPELWTGAHVASLLAQVDAVVKTGQDFEVIYRNEALEGRYPILGIFSFADPMVNFPHGRSITQGSLLIRAIKKTPGTANLKKRSEVRDGDLFNQRFEDIAGNMLDKVKIGRQSLRDLSTIKNLFDTFVIHIRVDNIKSGTAEAPAFQNIEEVGHVLSVIQLRMARLYQYKGALREKIVAPEGDRSGATIFSLEFFKFDGIPKMLPAPQRSETRASEEPTVTGQEFYEAVAKIVPVIEFIQKSYGKELSKKKILSIASELVEKNSVVAPDVIRQSVGASKHPQLADYFLDAYEAVIDSKRAPVASRSETRAADNATVAIAAFSQAVLARLEKSDLSDIDRLDAKRFSRGLSPNVPANATITRKDLRKSIQRSKDLPIEGFLLEVFDGLAQGKATSRSEARQSPIAATVTVQELYDRAMAGIENLALTKDYPELEELLESIEEFAERLVEVYGRKKAISEKDVRALSRDLEKDSETGELFAQAYGSGGAIDEESVNAFFDSLAEGLRVDASGENVADFFVRIHRELVKAKSAARSEARALSVEEQQGLFQAISAAQKVLLAEHRALASQGELTQDEIALGGAMDRFYGAINIREAQDVTLEVVRGIEKAWQNKGELGRYLFLDNDFSRKLNALAEQVGKVLAARSEVRSAKGQREFYKKQKKAADSWRTDKAVKSQKERLYRQFQPGDVLTDYAHAHFSPRSVAPQWGRDYNRGGFRRQLRLGQDEKYRFWAEILVTRDQAGLPVIDREWIFIGEKDAWANTKRVMFAAFAILNAEKPTAFDDARGSMELMKGAVLQALRSETRDAENKTDGEKSLRLQYAEWLERAAERARQEQIQLHKSAVGKSSSERASISINSIWDIMNGKIEPLSDIQRVLRDWAQRFRTKMSDDMVTGELAQKIMWRIPESGLDAAGLELALDILFEEEPPRADRSEMRGSTPMELLGRLAVSSADMMSFLKMYEMQMNLGLLKDGHSEGHQSLLSYAPKPTGKEKGLYWAVDFGGTNLRVIAVRFDGKGGSEQVGEPLKVRLDELDPAIFTGTAENLFSRFAGLVKQHFLALKAAGQISTEELQETKIAFTYSYPAKLNGRADSATAVQLVKNLKNPDLVGQDVARLFNEALAKISDAQFQNARVLAVVNDAVGTLAAAVDPEVIAGIIMGSGHGASYAESIAKIVKFDAAKQGWTAPDMMINLESADAILPGNMSFLTEIDRVMFVEENPLGQRPYEKLIGGMYLPELFRRYLKQFVEQGELFNGKMPKALRSSWLDRRSVSFLKWKITSSLFVGAVKILQDVANECFKILYAAVKWDRLKAIRFNWVDSSSQSVVDPEILTQMQVGDGRDAARETARLLGILGPSSTDLDIMIATVRSIYQRAAYLSAVELMALSLRASPELDRHVKIAIDGSLFEHSTSFRQWLVEALEVLAEARLGDRTKAKNIELKLVKDGSGLGAAMIVATLDASSRSEMRGAITGERGTGNAIVSRSSRDVTRGEAARAEIRTQIFHVSLADQNLFSRDVLTAPGGISFKLARKFRGKAGAPVEKLQLLLVQGSGKKDIPLELVRANHKPVKIPGTDSSIKLVTGYWGDTASFKITSPRESSSRPSVVPGASAKSPESREVTVHGGKGIQKKSAGDRLQEILKGYIETAQQVLLSQAEVILNIVEVNDPAELPYVRAMIPHELAMVFSLDPSDPDMEFQLSEFSLRKVNQTLEKARQMVEAQLPGHVGTINSHDVGDHTEVVLTFSKREVEVSRPEVLSEVSKSEVVEEVLPLVLNPEVEAESPVVLSEVSKSQDEAVGFEVIPEVKVADSEAQPSVQAGQIYARALSMAAQERSSRFFDNIAFAMMRRFGFRNMIRETDVRAYIGTLEKTPDEKAAAVDFFLRVFQDIATKAGRSEVREKVLTADVLKETFQAELDEINRAIFLEGRGKFWVADSEPLPHIRAGFLHDLKEGSETSSDPAQRKPEDFVIPGHMLLLVTEYMWSILTLAELLFPGYSGTIQRKDVPWTVSPEGKGRSAHTVFSLKFSEREAPANRIPVSRSEMRAAAELFLNVGGALGIIAIVAALLVVVEYRSWMLRRDLKRFAKALDLIREALEEHTVGSERWTASLAHDVSKSKLFAIQQILDRGDQPTLRVVDVGDEFKISWRSASGKIERWQGSIEVVPPSVNRSETRLKFSRLQSWPLRFELRDVTVSEGIKILWNKDRLFFIIMLTATLVHILLDSGPVLLEAIKIFWNNQPQGLVAIGVSAVALSTVAILDHRSWTSKPSRTPFFNAVKLIKKALEQHAGAEPTSFSLNMSKDKLYAIQHILDRGEIPELRLIDAGNEFEMSWEAPSGKQMTRQGSIELPGARSEVRTPSDLAGEAVLDSAALTKVLSQPYSITTANGPITRKDGFSGVYSKANVYTAKDGTAIYYSGSSEEVDLDAAQVQLLLKSSFPGYTVNVSIPNGSEIWRTITITQKSLQRSEMRLTQYLSKPDAQGVYTVPFEALGVDPRISEKDFDRFVVFLQSSSGETLRQAYANKLLEVAGQFGIANVELTVAVALLASEEGQPARLSVTVKDDRKIAEAGWISNVVMRLLEEVAVFLEENIKPVLQPSKSPAMEALGGLVKMYLKVSLPGGVSHMVPVEEVIEIVDDLINRLKNPEFETYDAWEGDSLVRMIPLSHDWNPNHQLTPGEIMVRWILSFLTQLEYYNGTIPVRHGRRNLFSVVGLAVGERIAYAQLENVGEALEKFRADLWSLLSPTAAFKPENPGSGIQISAGSEVTKGNDEKGRSELRTAGAIELVPQVEVAMPDFVKMLRGQKLSLAVKLRTAAEVTGGILERAVSAAKGSWDKIVSMLFPQHLSAVPTGSLANKTREKAMAILGIRTVPVALDVFVLGHEFFSQDHRVAVGVRQVYSATPIIAIVKTAGERAFLKELNLRLAKEKLLPILAADSKDPSELKAHLASVKGGAVRATALLYAAETVPVELVDQIPNTETVTPRMLKGFLNAVDMLVSGLVSDLRGQFAVAHSA